MTTYLIHETMNCEVTFVRRIEADDETDAIDGAHDGDGELLGVSIGDILAGGERTEILDDAPYNIPAHFYPEPSDCDNTSQNTEGHDMTAHRTIDFDIDAVTQTSMADITGSAALWRTIGYLSAWNMTYAMLHLTAYIDSTGTPVIAATYHRQPENRGDASMAYVLVGVWDGEAFHVQS